MSKSPLLAVTIIMLSACTNSESTTHNLSHRNPGYFADALDCSQSAMRQESVNVPTAGSVSIVKFPLGYDASKFTACME